MNGRQRAELVRAIVAAARQSIPDERQRLEFYKSVLASLLAIDLQPFSEQEDPVYDEAIRQSRTKDC